MFQRTAHARKRCCGTRPRGQQVPGSPENRGGARSFPGPGWPRSVEAPSTARAAPEVAVAGMVWVGVDRQTRGAFVSRSCRPLSPSSRGTKPVGGGIDGRFGLRFDERLRARVGWVAGVLGWLCAGVGLRLCVRGFSAVFRSRGRGWRGFSGAGRRAWRFPGRRPCYGWVYGGHVTAV